MGGDSGWEHRGHICGSAQVLIMHEERDPIGAEGMKDVRGPSSGAALIFRVPLLCLSAPSSPHLIITSVSNTLAPHSAVFRRDIRVFSGASWKRELVRRSQGRVGAWEPTGLATEDPPCLASILPTLTMGAPRCPTSLGLGDKSLGSMIQVEEMHRGAR